MENPLNTGEAIEKLKRDLLSRGTSLTTWEGDYWKILKRLPQDQPLTGELMHTVLLATKPNTKTRKRASFCLGRLAKFASIEYDPSPYKGKYSANRPTPRDIPTDKMILEYWQKLTNPAYRWAWGMMAAYGIRPHELVHLELETLKTSPILWVLDGKTGQRRVRPLHPEWYQQFLLDNPLLPGLNLSRDNSKIGHTFTRYYTDCGIPPPCKLYSLRHAYALRALKYGLAPKISAKMMGHSVAVHQQIYQMWLDEEMVATEYDRVIQKNDRPLPP